MSLLGKIDSMIGQIEEVSNKGEDFQPIYKISYVSNKHHLVYGFVREQEQILSLSRHITAVVVELIIGLFPLLSMPFGKFNEEMFTISEDKTILKVTRKQGGQYHKYYMVYADLGPYSDTGLDKGVHTWTIKLRARNWKSKYVPEYCGRRIGIVTNQNPMDCNESASDDLFKTGYDFMIDNDRHASEKQWKIDGKVTIKFDCNKGELTYYLDGRMKKIQHINAEEKYYIGLSCCVTHNHFYYQIVETPYEMSLKS